MCGSASDAERIVLREMLFGTRETFPYLRCPTCGALRIETFPTDLARHYPPDYYANSSAVSDPPRARIARAADGWQIQASLFGAARWPACGSRAGGPQGTP